MVDVKRSKAMEAEEIPNLISANQTKDGKK
jgi:hypothetical protein